MLSTCRALSTGVLNQASRFGMNHIKDMREENTRVRMAELQAQPLITHNARVYKPSSTIEFNREGEVLLYSANPINSETLYFKYPYIFCTCLPLYRRIIHPPLHAQLRPQSTRHGLALAQLWPLWQSRPHHPPNLVLQ